MRYTTLIDITEHPAVYRNMHCRLLYLHLALSAGYHDDDRDICSLSIRMLAAETGLTVSAVRHALAVLIREGLASRTGDKITVTKFCLERSITKRAKTQQEQTARDAAKQREDEQQQREAALQRQRRERAKAEATGKTPYMQYYEAQMAKAAAGDKEAQRIVERNRSVYEAHKKQIQQAK